MTDSSFHNAVKTTAICTVQKPRHNNSVGQTQWDSVKEHVKSLACAKQMHTASAQVMNKWSRKV